MRSLYLRIYLTVVAALALFALVSGWLWQHHLEEQRQRAERLAGERMSAWAELLQRSLPPAEAPPEEQAAALREWSAKLRLPMALDDPQGRRIGASEAFARRELENRPAFTERVHQIRLNDGRVLRVPRVSMLRPGAAARAGMGAGMGPGMGATIGPEMGPPGAAGSTGMGPGMAPPQMGAGLGAPLGPAPGRSGWLPAWLTPAGLPEGAGLAALLVVLFAAVAGGAYPVVRRLTRRLEGLKQGVETFGAGALSHRVDEAGRDEVAAVASSFNRAASKVEALLRSHQSLLANASHELRSPLARLKMAISMLEDAPPESRAALRREIATNVAELDALVDEILLASRLDALASLEAKDAVSLLALGAEEAARVQAQADGEALHVKGDERLLRRALRNLLENARRYGGGEVEVQVARRGPEALVRVSDRGPGVPEAYRERIFEPFFRLPGHAERAGGVGLGLSLVRQIAERHGGHVSCEPRPGGGSSFVLALPLG
jgi:signal transduction histidine kinase